jgi:hypothetical protein
MAPRHLTGGLAILASLSACSLDPVDLAGLQCPCADGWTCVGTICVEDGADAGARDLGVEADLGPRDLGAPDTGADGGPADLAIDMWVDGGAPSVCDTTTAFFCDGFEGSVVPPWTSVRETNEATFSTDGMPFRGERSGHGVTIAPSSRAHVSANLGGRTGTIHSRAWIYVPSTSPHETLSFLLIGHDADPEYPLVALQATESGSRVYVGVPFMRLATGGSSVAVPRDRWICATLSVDTGDASPHLLATIDGNVVADETFGGAVVPSADFGNAGIEFTSSSTPSAEIFIDEVEFGSEPLPCD